jgi:leukotriene-A4 hydrolase
MMCAPVVFLERLATYEPLPSSHILHLGELYSFNSTQNAEIRERFYVSALKGHGSDAARSLAEPAMRWVTGQDGSGIVKGRMKFCRPVFRAVGKVDHSLAQRFFESSKNSFHPIARKLIEKVRYDYLPNICG